MGPTYEKVDFSIISHLFRATENMAEVFIARNLFINKTSFTKITIFQNFICNHY